VPPECLELHIGLVRIFYSLHDTRQLGAGEDVTISFNSYIKALSSLLEKVQWGELIPSLKVEQDDPPSAEPETASAAAADRVAQVAMRIRRSMCIAETAALLLRLCLHGGLRQTHSRLLADMHILNRLTAWPSLADALEILLLDASQPLPASALQLLQDLLHVRSRVPHVCKAALSAPAVCDSLCCLRLRAMHAGGVLLGRGSPLPTGQAAQGAAGVLLRCNK
jgi:hypothetical protein